MKARLVFFGTGSSVGSPVLRCIMQREERRCPVCEKAHAEPDSVFARTPPSLFVQRLDAQAQANLLIDCGPGFKKSALKFFPALGVRKLDAVLLTHDHYDAVSCLNELREVQVAANPPGVWKVDTVLPVYGNEKALQTSQQMFPYLFSSKEFPSLTGKLEPKLLAHGTPFQPPGFEGLPITPLDIEHGEGYMCLGFLFGNETKIAYISDASRIPDDAMRILKESGVSILIIDAISLDARPSHFSLDQALAAAAEIAPTEKVYLVGMGCSMHHHETNELLAAKKLAVSTELAYDGLSLTVTL